MSKGRAIRVLYLVTDLDAGGAEKALVRIATGLDRATFRPAVVGLGVEGALAERLRAAGIPVTACGMRPTVPATWAALFDAVETFAPDVLHAFLFHANAAGRLARAVSRVPAFVASVRVSEPRASHLRFDRWAPLRPDRVVCVCEAVRLHLLDAGAADPERCIVIPNGVDPAAAGAADGRRLRDALGILPGTPVALCVARLDPQKGIDLLLEAWRSGPAQTGAVLLIAGDGPDRESLARHVTEAGIDGSVRFLGRVEDPAPYYAAVDLFVLPSRWEGLPNALLEARAAGLPAVATAVGGASEILAGSGSARLVPPGDAAAFSDAVVRLLRERDGLRRRASAEVPGLLERYRWEDAVAAHEKLYEELGT